MTNLEMLCSILGITEDMLKKVVAGKAVINYKELIGKGDIDNDNNVKVNETQVINELAAKEKVKSMEKLFEDMFNKVRYNVNELERSISGLTTEVNNKTTDVKEITISQPVAIPQKEETFEELFPEEKTTVISISSDAERAIEEHSQLVEKESVEADKVLESFDKDTEPNLLSQWESMEKAPVNVMRDNVETKIESTPWDISKTENPGSESQIKGTSDPDWMSTKW